MASADPAALDAADPLGSFRRRFHFPDPGLVYLDGNSLGRLPIEAMELSRHVVERQWGDRLIRSWNESWLETWKRIGDKLGELVGASPGEVAIAESTSVNLFKLTVAALRHQAARQRGRRRVLTDDLNFPSDGYILRGAIDLLDDAHKVEVVPSADGLHGPTDDLIARLDDDVALVTLPHVAYASGYLYDLPRVTHAAHEVGAMVLWDLSHSVGSVPIDLSEAGVDLAVGCTYKYLNGGPGAPAFLYVRGDLHEMLPQPITGWLGHARPFDFAAEYDPAATIDRFLTGTPPMVSLALIEPGLDLVLEAGTGRLRDKSLAQTGYLIERWDAELRPLGFSLKTPHPPERRGSHVSLGHPDGLGIDLALIDDLGVLPDFRPPDNLRLGIAPLYTRYVDVATAVDALITVVAEGLHHRYATSHPTVP